MHPNGLTDEQINARPKPFIGMVMYCPETKIWEEVTGISEDYVEIYDAKGVIGTGYWMNYFWPQYVLLPGERACPSVPPEYQRQWKVGDRAWITYQNGYGTQWVIHEVTDAHDDPEDDGQILIFREVGWKNLMSGISINAPAIYIPNESR